MNLLTTHPSPPILELAELFPNCVTEVETEESNREQREQYEQGETDHKIFCGENDNEQSR